MKVQKFNFSNFKLLNQVKTMSLRETFEHFLMVKPLPKSFIVMIFVLWWHFCLCNIKKSDFTILVSLANWRTENFAQGQVQVKESDSRETGRKLKYDVALILVDSNITSVVTQDKLPSKSLKFWVLARYDAKNMTQQSGF